MDFFLKCPSSFYNRPNKKSKSKIKILVNNFTKKVVGEWNRGSVKQYKKLSCENVFIISNAMTYRDVVYYTIFKRVEHIERGLNIA